MHEQPATGPHHTTTTERGSFALARCACGWSGPARRSRDRARTDATDHLGAVGAEDVRSPAAPSGPPGPGVPGRS
ncbi:hypothetical protein ACFQ8C_26290 [Streptomyces sp. NPDC056503]|uniref:hypothetical protein n=1 Tax=Streptomyces sp. NPDC056503 TaxID=3345842 RepID=UPI0036BBB5E7